MAKGTEHVEVALKLVQSTADTIGKTDGVADDWKAGAVVRLGSIEDLLRVVMDRFFLKTRVCLPFARKCAKATEALTALLAGQQAAGDQERLSAAIEALEKAARTLDERSIMQGMAIT